MVTQPTWRPPRCITHRRPVWCTRRPRRCTTRRRLRQWSTGQATVITTAAIATITTTVMAMAMAMATVVGATGIDGVSQS